MNSMNRRNLIKTAGASVAMLGITGLDAFSGRLAANEAETDSLPMQLYKSMSNEQRHKICLPADHAKRQYVSNWWYIHPKDRIPGTFNDEQQALIQNIFDSLHSPDYQAAVRQQVETDQYGELKNAPAVAFFGTPEDDDFEFLYTGHHVTRRCNVHEDRRQGFGGAPLFYGHFPDEFNETKDHPGNPYWYQGKAFNQFVHALDGRQQQRGLVSAAPRKEKPETVVQKKTTGWEGLACADMSRDQQKLLINTMGTMMAMFRKEDVQATLAMIEQKGMVDQLHVSWYEGKFDIGSDKVWDTWQIEGPELVWYFRGQPHIHSYFHLKS